MVADSVGLIWRVDLSDNGRTATAGVWLQDPSMNPGPPVVPPQPGINGIENGRQAGHMYYTSTFQELFLRVRVDPETFNPAAAPELIATGSLWDDFDTDQKAGAAYITTHWQNTLQRVPLDPNSGQAIQTIAGQPFDPQLAGPSDFAWGPGPQDVGSVAYLTTDGGVTAPPARWHHPARQTAARRPVRFLTTRSAAQHAARRRPGTGRAAEASNTYRV